MTQAASESTELPEGMTLLDRYTIIDRVAGGGMATIYRATDERLDRIVCVKLLRLIVESSGSTSGGSVYQATYSHFLKEALALSKLQHPNTLRIYDFGYLEGAYEGSGPSLGPRPFQISEFLDGGNLEQHVRARGALTPQETLAILERMAGATEEAHTHGIIHRDIKPSNILFSRVGGVLMPKLADFGIARCDLRKRPRPGDADDFEEISVSTVPLFSPRWAAPEQLAGLEEGPYTDVYALGLVAAYMLAGRAPFDLDDVRSTFSERVRGDDLVNARLVVLGFSPDLRSTLLSAMRANPRARTATPLQLFEMVNRALGGTRNSLPPPAPRAASQETITLEHWPASEQEPVTQTSFVPPDRVVDLGGRRVRVVEVQDKLDLTLSDAQGLVTVRFRVALLPAPAQQLRTHIKGLNCFVATPGGRPTPAVVSETDGVAHFVSMNRAELGSIQWSFGHMSEPGRVFGIEGHELMIPYPQGNFAVAIDLGRPREVIVICRRN